MTLEQAIAFCVLGLALVLFAWGRWRHDIVALIALVTVVVAGLVPATDALSGFGHPAVITVAAVLVLSRGLRNSGVVDVISAQLEPFTKNELTHVSAMAGVVAILSAFMNNVGALAILMPVALATAARRGRSPAIIMMPLAFGSILGGLMTLIGTPPNIIIATYRQEALGASFGMFDFSPVGIPIAVMGVLFTAIIGWRFLPKERRGKRAPEELFKMDEYVTEVRIKEDSPLAGKRITHLEHLTGHELEVTARVRESGDLVRPARWEPINAGDLLVIKADPAQLKPKLDELGLEVVVDAPAGSKLLETKTVHLMETVVTPNSLLESRTPRFLRRHSGDALNVLAVARPGEPVKRRLHNVQFRAGDVLLLQAEDEAAAEALTDLGLLPLPERELKLGQPRRVGLAVGIFAAAIGVSAFGLLPIAIAFLAAIVAYVLADLIPIRELYRSIDWPVIVLLGAMIPVGGALEQTGAAGLIGDLLVTTTAGTPPWVILTLILVVTMTLSDVVNNAATALIMAPIGVAVAGNLGYSPDPFLMAVAVGASCAFLTPIGHQSNTLVMGPGGYQFSDYWRMGLPLEILIVAAAVPLILTFWPL